MTGRVPHRDIGSTHPGTLLRVGVTVPADTDIRVAVHPSTTFDHTTDPDREHVATPAAAAVFVLIHDLLDRVAVLTAQVWPHQLPPAPVWQRPVTTPDDRKVGRA